MTFWDLVTSNSSLPVQAGNTFWDHMNNQRKGVGGNMALTSSINTNFTSSIDLVLSSSISDVNLVTELTTEV